MRIAFSAVALAASDNATIELDLGDNSTPISHSCWGVVPTRSTLVADAVVRGIEADPGQISNIHGNHGGQCGGQVND